MKNGPAEILSNERIAEDTYEMVLRTGIAREVRCGQFVQVQVPGYFLRRPISVHRVLDENTLSLIYKVVGDGTRTLSPMHESEK